MNRAGPPTWGAFRFTGFGMFAGTDRIPSYSLSVLEGKQRLYRHIERDPMDGFARDV